MKQKQGKFIVIYGANNLGKTTQTNLLAKKLVEHNKEILRVKYPIYNLEPTGPKIHQILRKSDQLEKPMEESDFQILYAQNRRDFQPVIKTLLEAKMTIIAEDYTGTGMAWGMTREVPLKYLEKINKNLINPDLSILLDGETSLI